MAIPVLHDRERALSDLIKLPGTPSILLLDAAGQIRDHSWALKHARGVRAFVARVRHFMG